MSEVKQVQHDGPMPRHLIDKHHQMEKEKERRERDRERMREKEKEKEKEKRGAAEAVQENGVNGNGNNVLKIKYNINVARDASPSNIRMYNNPTPKVPGKVNKEDFNPFLKKKKDHAGPESEWNDFNPFKRKESPSEAPSKRAIGQGAEVKPVIYANPNGNKDIANIRRDLVTPSSQMPAPLRQGEPLVKPNHDFRSKSPNNIGERPAFGFKPNGGAERPNYAGAGGPVSCRNDRADHFRADKIEARPDKIPSKYFLQSRSTP